MADEETVWKSQSRQHWLKKGDGNIKFFHAMANARRRANAINVVVANGRTLYREEEKRDHLFRYFNELFAPNLNERPRTGEWNNLFGNKPFLNPDNLSIPFSEEEVKKATFQLDSDKASGPDGFNLRFYQRFWWTIKDGLMNIFRELFEGNFNFGPLDFSYICLIPKKERAVAANDFRPICLINGVQKIIYKVLANRLERAMDGIISPGQAAFLKKRSILDSFVTAREILSWSYKGEENCIGVKADFEKAYDRVSWDFINKALRWLGADQKWCVWIDKCITNAKVAILENGTPTKWIKTRMGFRQGDPLSPYLFLIVSEGLARLTNKTIQSGLFSGVGSADDAKFFLIQYADDTIFLFETKARHVRNLQFVWQFFE